MRYQIGIGYQIVEMGYQIGDRVPDGEDGIPDMGICPARGLGTRYGMSLAPVLSYPLPAIWPLLLSSQPLAPIWPHSCLVPSLPQSGTYSHLDLQPLSSPSALCCHMTPLLPRCPHLDPHLAFHYFGFTPFWLGWGCPQFSFLMSVSMSLCMG